MQWNVSCCEFSSAAAPGETAVTVHLAALDQVRHRARLHDVVLDDEHMPHACGPVYAEQPSKTATSASSVTGLLQVRDRAGGERALPTLLSRR